MTVGHRPLVRKTTRKTHHMCSLPINMLFHYDYIIAIENGSKIDLLVCTICMHFVHDSVSEENTARHGTAWHGIEKGQTREMK